MPKDIYLQPHLPDEPWDSEMVLSLVRRHVPGARTVMAVDESGGEARSYAVDKDIVLKTQRPNRLRPRTSLKREAFFLNQIAALQPDLPVPRVLGYGHEGPSVEYTVLTRMPGVALRNAKLDRAARLEIMRRLGQTLRRLHHLPQPPFVESGLFPGDRSAADVRRRIEELLEEFSSRIQDERLAWSLAITPQEVSARTLALMPDSDVRVALHSNPWHEHTFVDPATGQFSGIIDFGDSYISHPTLDLRRWRDRGEREALLEGYTSEHPVDDEFLAMWHVAQVVGDMAAVAGSPALARAAEADLEHLLRQV